MSQQNILDGFAVLQKISGFLGWHNKRYPIDLNANLDFSRGVADRSTHPYPYVIGAIVGLCPLFDAKQIFPARRDAGWGTAVSVQQTGQTPPNLQYQYYDLQKVKG